MQKLEDVENEYKQKRREAGVKDYTIVPVFFPERERIYPLEEMFGKLNIDEMKARRLLYESRYLLRISNLAYSEEEFGFIDLCKKERKNMEKRRPLPR